MSALLPIGPADFNDEQPPNVPGPITFNIELFMTTCFNELSYLNTHPRISLPMLLNVSGKIISSRLKHEMKTSSPIVVTLVSPKPIASLNEEQFPNAVDLIDVRVVGKVIVSIFEQLSKA